MWTRLLGFLVLTTMTQAADSTAFAAESMTLMNASNSIASGMRMTSKYMPLESAYRKGAHPIVSLRQNRSDVRFELGLGSYDSNTKIGRNRETEVDTSIMHVGLGTTIVSSQGIRFGAHLETGDDPATYKDKKPFTSSNKIKSSRQDVGFFAAAGLTQNFGIGLNLVMTDSKFGDNKESATLISPAFMGMFETTEVIFDLIQANEDVAIDGHWRASIVHMLQGSTFLTGEMARVKPNSGDDFWSLAIGGRKKYDSASSIGAEALYAQQQDSSSGNCSLPPRYGIRADVDHGLATSQIISLGATYRFGKCSENDTEIEVDDLQFKGAFSVLF